VNILIYVACIVGSMATMAVVYYLIKKYAYTYLLVVCVGAGIVSARIIIAKDLPLTMSIATVIILGLAAGIFAIPALLMSDIDDLEEKLRKPDEEQSEETLRS